MRKTRPLVDSAFGLEASFGCPSPDGQGTVLCERLAAASARRRLALDAVNKENRPAPSYPSLKRGAGDTLYSDPHILRDAILPQCTQQLSELLIIAG